MSEKINLKDFKMASNILKEEIERENLSPMISVLDKIEDFKMQSIKDKANEEVQKVVDSFKDKDDLCDQILEVVPLFYDKNSIWWMWVSADYCWRMIDETEVLRIVYGSSSANILNAKERGEILTALKIKARGKQPKEMGSKLIQFQKEYIDLESGDRKIADSSLFFTNPIPWKIGNGDKVDKFDKLFKSWVGEEDVLKLYEIIAYCLIPEYPLERVFALLGSGSNGKSTFLKILYTFLGISNVTTTDLETMTRSRFETARLFKKLACIMGETNLSNLENSQIIKRLVSGKDPVRLEWKGKGNSEFINYAKLIIATNNLPPTDDKTDGFYRKWLIVDFPNQFEKEIDILGDLTTEDYEALAGKSIQVLDDLLKRRSFSNEGSIQQRKERYEEKSNPFEKFWAENVDDSNPDSDIPCWEFKKNLDEYMKDNRHRTLTDRAITKLLREKGVEQGRLMKEWFEAGQVGGSKLTRCWKGVKWKE